MQEKGLSPRHTRCAYVLIAISLPSVVYFLYTYTQENSTLMTNQLHLTTRLKNYRSLHETSIAKIKKLTYEVNELHETNNRLSIKTFKQKKMLFRLNSSHEDAKSKLNDAYKFYLDVKDLVADDQIASLDRSIHAETLSSLIDSIKTLKMNENELKILRNRESRRKQELKELQTKNEGLTKEVKDVKGHYREVYDNNMAKDKDLHGKDQLINENKRSISDLQQTVVKLNETIAHAFWVKNETAQLYEQKNKELKKKNAQMKLKLSKLMWILHTTNSSTKVEE